MFASFLTDVTLIGSKLKLKRTEKIVFPKMKRNLIPADELAEIFCNLLKCFLMKDFVKVVMKHL